MDSKPSAPNSGVPPYPGQQFPDTQFTPPLYPPPHYSASPYPAEQSISPPYPNQPTSFAPYPTQPNSFAPYPTQPNSFAPYPTQQHPSSWSNPYDSGEAMLQPNPAVVTVIQPVSSPPRSKLWTFAMYVVGFGVIVVILNAIVNIID